MVQTVLFRLLWMVVLVLVQALVLNKVNILGYITPYLYIYIILKADVNESRNSVMLWAFLCGILVDVFSDSPGINAASSVFLAFVRPNVLSLFVSRDALEQGVPSIKTIGIGAFTKYVAVSALLHHSFLVAVSYFSLTSVGEMILRVVLSSVLTVVFILLIDNIRK